MSQTGDSARASDQGDRLNPGDRMNLNMGPVNPLGFGVKARAENHEPSRSNVAR